MVTEAQLALRHWIVAWIAEGREEEFEVVPEDEPFSALGLDSVDTAQLAVDLGDHLGREIDVAVLFEHPTVTDLVEALTAEPAPAPEPRRPRSAPDAPIAIVGIACRVPGAASPRELWAKLCAGDDLVTEVPPTRWDVDTFWSEDPAAPGRSISKWGGFVDGVDLFDARFFRIPPAEAARMDPQHRLLLEVAWEALEDAGATGAKTRSATGVFVGISSPEYGLRQLRDPAAIDGLMPTGGALSIAASRISYAFDFNGPCLAVDTACSSSLVATHLACNALRAGECEQAVVGGVNLILEPGVTVGISKAGMLSPHGRCAAFAAAADGYVRSEGCVAVVLKPLDAALEAGDRVYAVVRGSAVNQDGRSNGLTAPNPGAQQAVLRAAYAAAGVDPGDVDYVECHGTGTFLGDPIEAGALGAVVGARDGDAPCLIGSVKSNLGHLEAAAGLAGLVKVALALHHGAIPPSIHFDQPNPTIAFDDLGLDVVTELTPWPADARPRRAGISSFGFGGTNAHAVLESAPPDAADSAPPRYATHAIVPISAATPAGVSALADGMRAVTDDWGSVAYTAAVRRAHHEYPRVRAGGDPRPSATARWPASPTTEAAARGRRPASASCSPGRGPRRRGSPAGCWSRINSSHPRCGGWTRSVSRPGARR